MEPPRVNWNRFEDAAKQAGNEKIEIKDISVILRESVEMDSKPQN
jgi:hypothetical protein